MVYVSQNLLIMTSIIMIMIFSIYRSCNSSTGAEDLKITQETCDHIITCFYHMILFLYMILSLLFLQNVFMARVSKLHWFAITIFTISHQKRANHYITNTVFYQLTSYLPHDNHLCKHKLRRQSSERLMNSIIFTTEGKQLWISWHTCNFRLVCKWMSIRT